MNIDEIDSMLAQQPATTAAPPTAPGQLQSVDDIDSYLSKRYAEPMNAIPAEGEFTEQQKIMPENLYGSLGKSLAMTKEGVTQAYLQSRLEGERQHRTDGLPYVKPEQLADYHKRMDEREVDIIDDLLATKELLKTYGQYDKTAFPQNESIGAQAIRSTVESSPTVAAGLVGFMLGGPVGGMSGATVAGGAQTFSDSYLKYSPMMSHGEAVTHSLIDTALETMGDRLLFKVGTKQGSSIVRRMLTTIGVGAGEEMSTTAMQDFHEWISLNPNLTVKEALEHLAVAGLAGAGTGAVVSTGAKAVDLLNQMQEPTRARNMIKKLLVESMNADSVKLRPADDIAVRLLDPNAGRLPESPWTTPQRIDQVAAGPTGYGEGLPTVSAPVETQTPNTEKLDVGKLDSDAYGASTYLYTEDLIPVLEPMMQADPKAAAEFVFNNMTQIFGQDIHAGIEGNVLPQLTPGSMAERLLNEGIITEQQRDEFLNELDRLWQDDQKVDLKGARAAKKDLLDEATKIANRLRKAIDIPFTPFEIAEGQSYKDPNLVTALVSAQTVSELRAALTPFTDTALRGSVTAYLAEMSLRNLAGFNPNQKLDPIISDPIYKAFAQRAEEVQHLTDTGLVPQLLPRVDVGKLWVYQGLGAQAFDEVLSGYGVPTSTKAALQQSAHIEVIGNMKYAAQFESLARGWLKKFGLDNCSVMIISENRPDYNGHHNAATDASGHRVLIIAVKNSLKAGRQFETFAHEMGHAIVPALLERSSPELRAAIMATYNEKLRSLSAMQVHEAMNILLGPITASQTNSTRLNVDMNKLLAAELLAKEGDTLKYVDGGFQSGYHLSLEEYLAHEMERVFARDALDMDPSVKSFFLKALGVLKQIYADFRKQPLSFEDQTFAQFLDYHARSVEVEARLERALKLTQWIRGMNFPMDTAPLGYTFKQMRAINPDVLTVAGERESLMGEMPVDSRIEEIIRKKFGIDEDLSGLNAGLDRFTWAKRLFGTLLTIARDNPHIKELSDPTGPIDAVTGQRRWGYLELAQFFHQERMRWLSAADTRVKIWNKLGNAQKELLADALLDETVNGRHLTQAELNQRGLTPDTIDLYREVKADFANFTDSMEQAAIARANRKHAGSLALPQILQDIQARFALMKAKPYFPLSRFGKFLVVVRVPHGATQALGQQAKGGSTLWYEAFDTKLEAMASVKDLKAQFPGMTVKLDKVNEVERQFMGIPPQLWEVIKDDLNLDPQQITKLNELMYKMSPDQSFTKHFIQRKKVKGYSADALRGYAHYFMHGSGHLAKLLWTEQLQDAAGRMRQSANEVEGDAVKRRRISDYVGTHLSELLNPSADWARLRATTAVLYLGGMLRSSVTNVTQVPMFTYPHLAAKFGDAAAVAEITKAYAALRRITTATRPLKGWENDALNKYAQGQPLTPKEDAFVGRFTGLGTELRAGLEQGVREGFLDESFAMTLAGLANGNMLSRMQATSWMGYYSRTLSHTAMIPFEMMEKMNRRVTFTAAFNLELKRQMDQGIPAAFAYETAFQTAKTAVQQTQFEYAKWNRPELLRGRKGAMLMFMQYQFTALSFMMGGDKGWWRAWAVLFLFGGLFSLPFAEDIASLASWLLSSPNKRVNVKHEIKQFTKEMLGDGSDMLDHGIARHGFGLKYLGDMSGSVSMGRVIPGMDLLGSTADFDTSVVRGLNDVGGATTSLALQMVRGLTDDSLPMWKRLELIQPSALGDRILQSYRWLHEGAERSPNGSLITSFDTTNPSHLVEIAANLGGFTPRSVTAGEEGRGPGREHYYLRQEMVQFYAARKSELLRSYADAIVEKDADMRREAIKEMNKYNREVKIGALKITAASIQQSVNNKRKRLHDDPAGVGNTNAERGVEQLLRQ